VRVSEATTLRQARIKAVIKFYHGICKRRGLTQYQKDEILEKYLITAYGLGATARRDYIKSVKVTL